MDINELVESVDIFKKYYKPGEYCVSAERDQIYMYHTSTIVTETDYYRLVELGWFVDGVDDEADNSYDIYKGEYVNGPSWTTFV